MRKTAAWNDGSTQKTNAKRRINGGKTLAGDSTVSKRIRTPSEQLGGERPLESTGRKNETFGKRGRRRRAPGSIHIGQT